MTHEIKEKKKTEQRNRIGTVGRKIKGFWVLCRLYHCIAKNLIDLFVLDDLSRSKWMYMTDCIVWCFVSLYITLLFMN